MEFGNDETCLSFGLLPLGTHTKSPFAAVKRLGSMKESCFIREL